MKERVAIYARYSSEQQRDTSIDDQIRRCLELARKYGYAVDDVHVFQDAAITGKGTGDAKRQGFQQLLEAWDASAFGVLIVDEFSRLTRDGVTQAELVRRLENNRRVRLIAASGVDTNLPNWQLQVGLEGLIAQQAGRDTRHRVERGMLGQLERGFMIAPPPFGYTMKCAVECETAKYLGTTWIIDEPSAQIVREVFERRAQGQSMDAIARWLNGAGVPTSRKARKNGGGFWRPARIRGLLRNPIYKGVFVWHGSSKYLAEAKAKGIEVVEQYFPRPDLRLVSDDLWARCNGKTISRTGYGGCKHPLAGLLSCGGCEGTLVLSSQERCRSLYCTRCSSAKRMDAQMDRCSQTVAASGVRVLLIAAARHFMSEAFVEAFRDALRGRLEGGDTAELERARAELVRLERVQARLLSVLEGADEDDPLVSDRYAQARAQTREQRQHVDDLAAGLRAIDKSAIEAQLQVDPSAVLDGLFEADVPAERVRSVLARLFPEIVFEGKPASRYESVFRIRFAPGAALAMASGTGEIDGGEIELRFLLRYSPKGQGGEERWTVGRVDEALTESRAVNPGLSFRKHQPIGASLHPS